MQPHLPTTTPNAVVTALAGQDYAARTALASAHADSMQAPASPTCARPASPNKRPLDLAPPADDAPALTPAARELVNAQRNRALARKVSAYTPASLDALRDVEGEDVILGTMTVDVVGRQHYNGILPVGETAALVRQLDNQYDANAIRVDTMLGLQAGHIRATQARVLAPLVDTGVRMTLVAAEARDKYEQPARLTVHGPAVPAYAITVERHLRQHGAIFDVGAWLNLAVVEATTAFAREAAAATAVPPAKRAATSPTATAGAAAAVRAVGAH